MHSTARSGTADLHAFTAIHHQNALDYSPVVASLKQQRNHDYQVGRLSKFHSPRHFIPDERVKELLSDPRIDYIEPDQKISYCWHPKLRILVGGQWWCQWWEKIED